VIVVVLVVVVEDCDVLVSSVVDDVGLEVVVVVTV
jgi:hypothetical protein